MTSQAPVTVALLTRRHIGALAGRAPLPSRAKQFCLLLLLLLTRRLAWRLVQKLQGHVTHKKDDMFGRQRKKQEGQQRHQYEVANKYVFKCRTVERTM